MPWHGTAGRVAGASRQLIAIDAVAQRINVNVNRAADVNPVNLLALSLLSTPKHAMGESDLLAQIALSKTLLAEVPYGERITVTPHTPAQ